MSLFKGLFKKGSKDDVGEVRVESATDVAVESSSISKINLRKEEVKKICLKKKELTDFKCKVVAVFDCSISIKALYRNGTMQNVVDRIIPIAMNFDENGVLDAWLFSDECKKLNGISLRNYNDYLKKERKVKEFKFGGTRYAPAMEDIVIENKNSDIPVFVLFFTDGDNSDKRRTTEVMKEASKYPIFWQFIGMNGRGYDYLKNLDTMDGRYIDNANFFDVDDIDNITDTQLYNLLLQELPVWIREATNKNIIK